MDSDTRWLLIGLAIIAAGMVTALVSAYDLRGIIIPEFLSGYYCEASSCFQGVIIGSIGTVAGTIAAVVGLMLVPIAAFRILGRPS